MTARPPPSGLDAVELALTGMRRIAVVGLSPDPWRESHDVAAAMQRRGWEIVPVNPNVDEVLGEPAYPDLASVPGRIDVVNVFRRSEHLAGIADEAVGRDDVAVVWNQLGLRSPEAAAIVASADRCYVEDACLGVEVSRHRATPPRGPRIEGSVLLVDLDGTVLDYAVAERRALEGTLTGLGVTVDDAAVATYRRINGEHWRSFERGDITTDQLRTARWQVFVDETGLTADGIGAAHDYLGRLGASGDLLPRAHAALWWLGRRAPLVALTNGFDDVQRGRLAAAGLDHAFDGYVSSEGAGVAKPDPAIVDAALATVGAERVDRSEVVVIGDSLRSDVAVGVAVGATTVWIAPEASPPLVEDDPRPDHRVAHLADIA